VTDRIRALALRWGWDPDNLSEEQRDLIEDQIRCWAQ
jgi:hypothetical protein